jgi:hypothetical protein
MDYFDDGTWDSKNDHGYCSDNDCPCGAQGVEIARGEGYLFISQDVVNLRRKNRTDDAALSEVRRRRSEFASSYGFPVIGGIGVRIGPILMCEQGAKKRGIDLEIAANDAKYWWKTGKVPLRAPPLAVSKAAATQHADNKWQEIDIKRRVMIVLSLVSIGVILFCACSVIVLLLEDYLL